MSLSGILVQHQEKRLVQTQIREVPCHRVAREDDKRDPCIMLAALYTDTLLTTEFGPALALNVKIMVTHLYNKLSHKSSMCPLLSSIPTLSLCPLHRGLSLPGLLFNLNQ